MSETPSIMNRAFSRRRMLTNGGLLAAGIAGAGSLLAGCADGESGGPTGGSSQNPGAVTWGVSANPGEAERFKQFSQQYQEKSGVKVTFQNVTGDYNQKLLTQLSGGSAPDAFYVGDSLMAKLIESKQIVDLTEYLNSSDAAVKASDTYPGLLEWCKSADGSGIYGLPVDSNPKVFWYNKKMLDEVGVSYPADQFEAGTWNQDALTDLLTKIKATGKRGLVFQANWFDLCGWISALGGKIVDDDSGQVIFDQDPRALEVIEWLWDQMNSGNITYGGSLPKGQGVDALFYSEQLATIQYGRWILPNLKKLDDFEYDIAPLPSESGHDVGPCSVYASAMSVNAKAADQEVALEFLANFVNADGQRSRLSGGGNAVPAVAGLDDIVTEDNLPEHGAFFTEVVKNGYTTPTVLVRNPEAAANFGTDLDTLIKSKPTYQVFAQKAAELMNGKA